MTSIQRSLKVFIVSSSPIYASALQRLVGSSPIGWESKVFPGPALMLPVPDPPDAVLVAPWDWRELGSWISPLQKRWPRTP